MRFAFYTAWLTLSLALVSDTKAQDDRGVGAATFEVHAVADRPGPHIRSYLGVETGPDGKPASALLVDPPLLDGKAIRYVSLDYDTEDQPIILITFTGEGARRFEQITKDSVGKQLGLVIGGQLYSEPRVMETIRGGKITISGSFTARQAANLVTRLNAALPGRAEAR